MSSAGTNNPLYDTAQAEKVALPEWNVQPYNAFNVPIQFNVEQNFNEVSSVDILDVQEEQQFWLPAADDVQINTCISSSLKKDSSASHRLIAFFISLNTVDDARTTYGSRASISLQSAKSIISTYGIGDSFLPDFIGRPNYWPPYALHNIAERTHEFHCQHPRWQQPKLWLQHRLVQRAPSSTYMKHLEDLNLTLYVIAAAPNDDCITFFRGHLQAPENPTLGASRLRSLANRNPLLLHNIISSIVVEQSKDFVHDVRKTLMTQINEVNDYNKPSADRRTSRGSKKYLTESKATTHVSEDSGNARTKLEAITKDLHLVSQKADTGISNAEKAIENCQYILTEYKTFKTHFKKFTDPILESSIRYNIDVWQCQKRLLVSYKARKETSMNLVFNLVTQQDSTVNVAIAQSMLDDSSSMKTIAVLTMVFLLGTFLSALFSSGIFELDDRGHVSRSDLFMPFWYCLIPLTLAVIILWALRTRIRKLSGWIRHSGLSPWTAAHVQSKEQNLAIAFEAQGMKA